MPFRPFLDSKCIWGPTPPLVRLTPPDCKIIGARFNLVDFQFVSVQSFELVNFQEVDYERLPSCDLSSQPSSCSMRLQRHRDRYAQSVYVYIRTASFWWVVFSVAFWQCSFIFSCTVRQSAKWVYNTARQHLCQHTALNCHLRITPMVLSSLAAEIFLVCSLRVQEWC